MKWNDHRRLEGSHAIMGASKYSWLTKSNDEMMDLYRNSFATTIGTLLHSYASDSIRYRERIRKTDAKSVRFDLMRRGVPEFAIDTSSWFQTLMDYVNDGVGYLMDPEIVLYYSDLCFGTADAIQVDRNMLRIHDLKTGVTPAKMDQLMIYAALFCLEYGMKPDRFHTELRIYQSGDIVVYEPDPADIRVVMDSIIEKDRVLQKMKEV